MKGQNMKMAAGVLAGALIALGTAYPSVAEPAAASGEQLVAQANMREAYRGEVSSIDDETVTLEMPNGETKGLDIPRTLQTRLGIAPGTEIIVFDDDSYAVLQNNGTYAIVDQDGGVRMVESLVAQGTSVAEPAAASGEQLAAQTMMREAYRGKVSSINNQIVTLEMPNRETKRLDIPRTTQTRLGIAPGTEIIVFGDDSYAVRQNNGTYAIVDKNGGVRMVETLPTQQTTTQQTTTQQTTTQQTTTQPRTTQPTTTQPTTTQPRTTQPATTQPATTQPRTVSQPAPSRPVRALW